MQKHNMGKIIVIGAGLAGLSAGYHAALKNLDYDVYEAGKRVGGLCRTRKKEGFSFDFSGHLLHLKDPYFQGLVRELLSDNLNIINRNAVIYSHGAFTRYPFQANLYGLPTHVVKECLMEFVKAYYEKEDLPTRAYATFKEWIEAKLGKGIGKHFMFPYNEKLWTVSTEDMTCDWLSEYVPKPRLEDVFNGAFEDQCKGFGYNATFWYPKKGGIQALCDALAERVPNIHLNERAVAVDPIARTVRFASGLSTSFDRIISTMPLHRLMSIMNDELPNEVRDAVNRLSYNSVLIVNLGVKGANRTDKHWIYLPEKRFTAYRVGIYSNFSCELVPSDASSFYIEIGYQKGWNVDKEALVERAVADMIELGLVDSLSDILVKDVVDLECSYIIYDSNYSESRRIIMAFLNGHGIASIGRYGNWEYSGMEEAMQQGRRVINAE